jgi:hypothetical protein
MVTTGFFHGLKRPRREADHLPPSNTEVKEFVELYLHSPNTPSWGGDQLKKFTGTTLPLPLSCSIAVTWILYLVLLLLHRSFVASFLLLGFTVV